MAMVLGIGVELGIRIGMAMVLGIGICLGIEMAARVTGRRRGV